MDMPVIPEMLVKSRLAAYALNLFTREMGMGNYAHTFIGEHIDDFAEATDHIKALIDGKEVARVFLTRHDRPAPCTIMVTDIYDIVRPKALADFEPAQYGIQVQKGVDWMGDKFPDVMADINMTDVEIPNLNGPARPMPRHSLHHVPRVNGALSRSLH